MISLFCALIAFACSISALDRQSLPENIPDYAPEGSMFVGCEPPFKAYKYKCVKLIDGGDYAGNAMTQCQIRGFYPDVIESEEERRFVFNELLGGIGQNIFQPVKGTSDSEIETVIPGGPTDVSYIKTKITSYSTISYKYYNCTMTQDDIQCVQEVPSIGTGLPALSYCTIARPLYSDPIHECDIPIHRKLRKDATRTLTFLNDEMDVCYISIKNRRFFRSSMVKIYGYSSSCPSGFLVSTNVNNDIEPASLAADVKCGDGFGTGIPKMKMRSKRGGELRIYVVLFGDGTPMKIRAKGRAFQ